MKRVFCLPLVVALALVSAWTAAQDVKPALEPSNVLEEFDIASDGDALFVPVTLKGKTYQFCVSTGATANVFDASLLSDKPIGRVPITGEARSGHVAVHDAPDAFLGRLSLRTGGPVAATDLQSERDKTGNVYHGILGMSFLWQHIVCLDFEAGKLTILKEVGPEPGDRVELGKHECAVPCVWVEIPGWVREPFTVSTDYALQGSTGMLNRESFQGLVDDRKLKIVGFTAPQNFEGDSDRVGRGEGFVLNGHRYDSPVFREAATNCLGLPFLCQFRVIFDFPGQAMYLKRRPRRVDLWPLNISGVNLIGAHGKPIVRSIEPDSPAAACGLRAGDVVLGIGDKTADKASLASLRKLLAFAEKELYVAVQRGAQRIEATLMIDRREP